uniref:Tudor domain containing 15 n=1 Tax=Fundulus heteroclitus TaxID=8078 RepID=A0A3Q2QBK6_FUNHE
MQSTLAPEHQKSQESGALTKHALWSVDLKLTHLDWSPEATLIHFQGQYPSICELDYHILQQELQSVPKTKAAVDVGDLCLVEDVTLDCWFRGRVQSRKEDLLDVFLIDYGKLLSVNVNRISSCSDDLFIPPPKIVSGFLANVLLFQNGSPSLVEEYFSSLVGKNVTGFIQAQLPYKVLLLEAPDINSDLVRHGLGRHVDRDTFFLLFSMLIGVPLKQKMEPVPDLLIEKSRGQQFCYKPSSWQVYQDILSYCGPKLGFGTRAKVRVTAAVNPELFYCQMANAAAELWQISKKLADIFEHKTKGHSQKMTGNMGVMCAAKGKDQRWHRGLLQFLPANSQVRVFFIDYGFFEMADIENVHSLPREFHSTQFMAFQCTLPSQADHERTQQLIFLKAGLLGAVLEVEITGYDEDNHLYTVTVLSDEDTHVVEPEPIQNLSSEPPADVKNLPPQDRYESYEAIRGDALRRTLEAEELQVGSAFVGYIEYAQDPNNFWIRTQKRNQEFEEMMVKIREHFSQMRLDEDVLGNPEVGAMCCAMYEEDMHFYRGVVTDVLERGAEILFVDYGNIGKVPHKLIKRIPKIFASTPPFAICCTLANVFPSDDFWPSATLQFFRKAVYGKALDVHLLQAKINTFVVDLFEAGGDNSITELLISSKLAEFIPLNKDVLGKPRQPQRSEPNTSKTTEQGPDCKGEASLCRKEEKSQLVQVPVKSINPGFKARCFVTHIDSMSSFFLQMSDDESAILKMGEDLNSNVFKESLKEASPWSINDVVLAEFEEDGDLYRSVVKNQEDGSRYTVEFLDYGNSAVVGKEKLHPLPEEFSSQPRFSIPCSLMNTSAYKDEASFTEAVMDTALMVEFVSKYGIHWQVKVEVLDGESERDAMLSSTFVAKNEEKSSSLQASTENCKEHLKEEVHHGNTSREAKSTVKTERLGPEPSAKKQVQTTRSLRQTRFTKKKRKKSKTPSTSVTKDRLARTIQDGDTETGTILSVQSNGSFYVRLTKNNNLLASMERYLTENITEYKTVSEEDVAQDLKCLVQAEGGRWQRAVIRRIHERRFEVFLVDHGVTEDVPGGPVPKQCAYLRKIPNLALLCKMNNLGLSEANAAQQCWEDMLKPLVGTEVKVIFVGFSKAEKVWLVEIVLSGPVLVGQIQTLLQQNGEKTLTAESQSESTPPPPPFFFAPLHTDNAHSGCAAAVATPSEFSVVLEDLLPTMIKVYAMLDDLPGVMPPLAQALLVPGTCCLFRSESKNRWCRAELVHADDDMVVLNLVDYGHQESVPYLDFSRLKQVPVELTNFPKMTYPCVLRGVKPAVADGQWSDEATVFFQHCLCQKNLQIFFRESGADSTWKVDVLVDGVHVAKKLVDAGHADYTDVILGLRYDVSSSCEQRQRRDADEEEGLTRTLETRQEL